MRCLQFYFLVQQQVILSIILHILNSAANPMSCSHCHCCSELNLQSSLALLKQTFLAEQQRVQLHHQTQMSNVLAQITYQQGLLHSTQHEYSNLLQNHNQLIASHQSIIQELHYLREKFTRKEDYPSRLPYLNQQYAYWNSHDRTHDKTQMNSFEANCLSHIIPSPTHHHNPSQHLRPHMECFESPILSDHIIEMQSKNPSHRLQDRADIQDLNNYQQRTKQQREERRQQALKRREELKINRRKSKEGLQQAIKKLTVTKIPLEKIQESNYHPVGKVTASIYNRKASNPPKPFSKHTESATTLTGRNLSPYRSGKRESLPPRRDSFSKALKTHNDVINTAQELYYSNFEPKSSSGRTSISLSTAMLQTLKTSIRTTSDCITEGSYVN